MSTPLPPEFDARLLAGLAALEGNAELRGWAWTEVNGFYRRHAEIERNETGAAFLLSAIIALAGHLLKPDTEAWEGWAQALASYEGNAGLRTRVEALVEGFFAEHLSVKRTRKAERFIEALAIDRAASTHLSEAANQTPKTQAA